MLDLAVSVGMTKHRLSCIEMGAAGVPAPSILHAIALALCIPERTLRVSTIATGGIDGLNARTMPETKPDSAARDLRPGLALLRGLRRRYAMGQLSHEQLRQICKLANAFADPCALPGDGEAWEHLFPATQRAQPSSPNWHIASGP